MDSYSPDDILGIGFWANALPRKSHSYKTPDEAFEAELDASMPHNLPPTSPLPFRLFSCLRVCQGQIDDLLTQNVLNLLLQFGIEKYKFYVLFRLLLFTKVDLISVFPDALKLPHI